MNILMINGTMRKSSTYQVGRILIDRIKTESDTLTELFLPKDLPEFCRGCTQCIQQGEEKCPDYLIYTRKLRQLLNEADLLVFTTPVFACHASGQMKAFLDHFSYLWMSHRPEASMFRKQAICISTGAGFGMKKAVGDIKDSLRFWGVARIYTYGIGVGASNWKDVKEETKNRMEADLSKLAQKIQREPQQVTPSLKTKLLFTIMRAGQKKGVMTLRDQEYWEAKGWLNKERPWKQR